MLFALLAVQSAFACGPYGGFASSEEGAWAFENDDVITVYAPDGDRVDLPIYGELVDLDFVGEELVVAYAYKNQSFAILFDVDGAPVAEWSPRMGGFQIDDITVLSEGMVVRVSRNGQRTRVRLDDDLRPVGPQKVAFHRP